MPDRPITPTNPPRAVLLDAFGTLIALRPPVPRLVDALAAAGHPFPPDVVARAFAAEVAHYRAHHMRGSDAAGVAALRRDCAGVLARALGPGAPAPAVLGPLLVDALRFELMPDAGALLDGLARAGIPMALVSNWDASLRTVLRELGIADRFAAVCISAECGVAKPDPAIYARAVAALGVAPGDAVHCGDDPELDGAGAARAGIRAVLVDRADRHASTGMERVADLRELLGRLTAPRRPAAGRG